MTVRTVTDGSWAITSQRTKALNPPAITRMDGDHGNRGDSAKTMISATTPSAQRPAMIKPLRPAACQAIDAKV